MIPSGVHQVDVSLKHAQVIGIGGAFSVVPVSVSGPGPLAILVPVDADTFEVVGTRLGLAVDRQGNEEPGQTWTTLTFDDHGAAVTADRGTVHDYDGDGIWTWHDDQYECGECAP